VAENPFSFGGEHRYYGSRTAPDPATATSGATGEIAALLKEYDPELERRVSTRQTDFCAYLSAILLCGYF
jgi:hypothetical protein